MKNKIENLTLIELFDIAREQIDKKEINIVYKQFNFFVKLWCKVVKYKFSRNIVLWYFEQDFSKNIKGSYSFLKNWLNTKYNYETIESAEDFVYLYHCSFYPKLISIDICELILRNFIDWNKYLDNENIKSH